MSNTEPLTQAPPPAAPPPPAPPGGAHWHRGGGWHRAGRGAGFGVLLVILGVYFLLQNLGLLTWINWDILWPVVLIGFGLYIIVRRGR